MSMPIVSIVQPLCSMSKTPNSAPAAAERRPMPRVANSISIVPTTVSPRASLRLTRFSRIRAALSAPCVAAELVLKLGRFEDGTVDDGFGNAAGGHVENAGNRGAADAGKALVGPAEGMRGQDDVIEG